MAYRIRNGEGIGQAVARMARAELIDASRSIADTQKSATDRVHDMRTSLKKTRALMHLVRPAVGHPARRENRRLRDVADAVSRFRDADVVVKTFDVVVADLPPSARRAFSRARARLILALRTEKQRLVDDGQEERLKRRLRKRAKHVDRWVPRSGRWRAVGVGLVDAYRRARRAMAEAYRSDDAAAFHEWRRAVKAHRHQVHALQPLAPSVLGPRLAPLERLGELLGDEHDLTILGEALEGARTCFSTVEDRDVLLRALERRQAELRAGARPLGTSLFDERPSEFGGRAHAEMRESREKDEKTVHRRPTTGRPQE